MEHLRYLTAETTPGLLRLTPFITLCYLLIPIEMNDFMALLALAPLPALVKQNGALQIGTEVAGQLIPEGVELLHLFMRLAADLDLCLIGRLAIHRNGLP